MMCDKVRGRVTVIVGSLLHIPWVIPLILSSTAAIGIQTHSESPRLYGICHKGQLTTFLPYALPWQCKNVEYVPMRNPQSYIEHLLLHSLQAKTLGNICSRSLQNSVLSAHSRGLVIYQEKRDSFTFDDQCSISLSCKAGQDPNCRFVLCLFFVCLFCSF